MQNLVTHQKYKNVRIANRSCCDESAETGFISLETCLIGFENRCFSRFHMKTYKDMCGNDTISADAPRVVLGLAYHLEHLQTA